MSLLGNAANKQTETTQKNQPVTSFEFHRLCPAGKPYGRNCSTTFRKDPSIVTATEGKKNPHWGHSLQLPIQGRSIEYLV